ncbi:hypothetical protein D0U04_28060 [Bacillus clarus]|uniref:Uncharacterized protein n=1 Tax=Bacillus clarus TaxID=2338372 RepID=A0ABX9KNB5_9BACI|nr:hypothetical protein D0U04_28060 [Bacillus clarus]
MVNRPININLYYPIRTFFTILSTTPHVHQAKVLKYTLNENSLFLQLVIWGIWLIFSFWGCLLFLS